MELSVTTTQADEYFADRLYANAWNEATDDDKSKAVAWASVVVYRSFAFKADAKTTGDDGTVSWNDAIIYAVCEEALHLLKDDPTTIPDVLKKGLSEAKAGGASAKFDKRMTVPPVAPTAILLVGDLGVYLGINSGGTTPYRL